MKTKFVEQPLALPESANYILPLLLYSEGLTSAAKDQLARLWLYLVLFVALFSGDRVDRVLRRTMFTAV